MSSQSIPPSSPLSLAGGSARPRSRFTFKHLALLAASSNTCPLRVIAHIDLDAFYAQCESVRLGLPEDQPLAVQQWGGLIAINYPSRAFGVKRFTEINEAKRLCPNLILQHVATWKEGEERWAYRDDSAVNIGVQKVSLDPYRAESRKILACIKANLPPAPVQRVEKASVDEVFLDLSAQVHALLLERYPELAGPPPYDDLTSNLPPPPTTALDWHADALVDLDSSEAEKSDPDWDDVAMLLGSEIVRGVRAAIRAELKYTCSAGLAQNKVLAKLASAHKKPNRQTVVRNRAKFQFLSGFRFTQMRGMGGKLGDQVVAAFGTDELSQLLDFSLEQLKAKLDDDAGSWVYRLIRGDDTSEVTPRTAIKSMLSAKSFKPAINGRAPAERWLRIFVADIFLRLVDEGVVDNRRRPRTINLHHRHSGVVRSRQLPIPQGKRVDEALLFDLSRTLLGQIIVDGRCWPCTNLSLSVGGFEDGLKGNRGISGFFVTGEEAKAMNSSRATSSVPNETEIDDQGDYVAGERSGKRRKIEEPTSEITKFFAKTDQDNLAKFSEDLATCSEEHGTDDNDVEDSRDISNDAGGEEREPSMPRRAENELTTQLTSVSAEHTQYTCPKCSARLSLSEQDEHEDWHFAKALQDEMGQVDHADNDTSHAQSTENPRQFFHAASHMALEARGPARPSKPRRGRPRKTLESSRHGDDSSGSAAGRSDKGQTKLVFGR